MPYTVEYWSEFPDGSDYKTSVEMEGEYIDTPYEDVLDDIRNATITEGALINTDEPVEIWEGNSHVDDLYLDCLDYDFYNPPRE